MLAIASLPRSGNHLYRFILEFSTGAYTQGCLENNLDYPIFKNKFLLSPKCLDHVDPMNLLGIKCHSVHEVEEVFSTIPLDGVHLIVRNPANALSSNVGRLTSDELINIFKSNKKLMLKYFLNIAKSRKLSIRRFTLEYFIRRDFTQWSLLLREYFKVWMYSKCSHLIIYENLVDESKRINEIRESLSSIQSIIDPNKYNELVANIKFFYEVSATGQGRDWGGSRSLREGDLIHIKKNKIYSPQNFRELIANLLNKEYEYCTNNAKKYPGFRIYIEILDKYIRENS